MRNGASGPCLSAVFVDYDNIYLSLKRRNEEVAKRFAKDALHWLKEIESGRLITPTNGPSPMLDRRMVMNRCYGNPVPRRNSRDNSTDMSSFPFIRHHFLRAGFEIVDCPPLTAQLKNSSDIRMVMDIRDFLTHDTYFDEFVILSGDADFTPVLHRLRAHARRTVIYANEFTATPYTAICDGEIREEALMALLMDGAVPEITSQPVEVEPVVSVNARDAQRQAIVAEVVDHIRHSDSAVPIETLADRAQRALGYEKTIGTGWGGHGAFRTFLIENLPAEIRLTTQPPYLAFEPGRHADPEAQPAASPANAGAPASPPAQPRVDAVPVSAPRPPEAARSEPAKSAPPATGANNPAGGFGMQGSRFDVPPSQPTGAVPPPQRPQAASGQAATAPAPSSAAVPPSQPVRNQSFDAKASITRIHEACQAPALSPAQYGQLFEALAAEIKASGLNGAQTITNIMNRAQAVGLTVRRDDVRFVLDVVSEADPWFEQGASAVLFAGRFRNFVVARCRTQGLTLSAQEIDLIDAWFAGGALSRSDTRPSEPVRAMPPQQPAVDPVGQSGGYAPVQRTASGNPQEPHQGEPSRRANEEEVDRWWTQEERRQVPERARPAAAQGYGGAAYGEPEDLASADFGQMPRIVRSQMGQ
ncbi:MAG: NYN domain-containing protein [Rhizobiales bacterium]|nr:NYN domain-containing protein [Hyphomicrobiales bacterium]